MPEYSDIYVISDQRNEDSVENFLSIFLPAREESADEYEIPQFSDTPDIIYKNDLDLIKYCSENKSAEHAIYWRASDGSKPEHAMVFYLKDGHIIFGLSTDASDTNYANELLIQLKQHIGSNLGYIGHEASPDTENLYEFKLAIEKHKP